MKIHICSNSDNDKFLLDSNYIVHVYNYHNRAVVEVYDTDETTSSEYQFTSVTFYDCNDVYVFLKSEDYYRAVNELY